MPIEPLRALWGCLARARPGIVLLLIFTVLLGLMHWLLVNQKVLLYFFYFPVVYAGMRLPRLKAVGIALAASAMVIAYVFFLPQLIAPLYRNDLLWAELVVWAGILVLSAYMVATLKMRIQETLLSLEHAYRGVLAILSRFLEMADADTEAHCVRVSAWAVRIAREMRVGKDMLEEVRLASLLHDVGKAEISVDLLRKAAALSKKEEAEVRQHAAKGAAMVKSFGGMMDRIAAAIELHHEKYDGTGYRSLKGEDIPPLARIIAVADALDALLSDRPYRKGAGIDETLSVIENSAGRHFDPAVVAALQRVVKREGERPALEAFEYSSTMN